jgi:rubrerythrin
MADLVFPSFRLGRRLFLGRTGPAVLSAAAVALLAGRESLAAGGKKSGANDVGILNTALGAEQEAVAAYQVSAESGLLQPAVKDLAVTFQSQHKAHADLLASTIKKLGGAPVAAKKPADYKFPTDKLKTQSDVLRFAAGLEKGAVSAYLGAIPVFDNRDLAKAAGSILGDEAMHWAILRNALGEAPVPDAFVA